MLMRLLSELIVFLNSSNWVVLEKHQHVEVANFFSPNLLCTRKLSKYEQNTILPIDSSIIFRVKKSKQICLSASIDKPVPPQSNALEENNDDKDKSSGEMTMAEVDEIKQELLKTMPEKDAEGIASIFRKFTKDATDEDKFEGFVSFNRSYVSAKLPNSITYFFLFVLISIRWNWWC